MKPTHKLVILVCTLALAPGCSETFRATFDTGTDAVPDSTDMTGDTGVDVPDGEDAPDGDVEPDGCEDSDDDGVCDEDDVCPGGDDTVDTDGDTIPDYCDCEGLECDENAHCEESGGDPECVCNEGYEGDGFTCSDIDECTRGTHTCDSNATCTNTEGSYECTCNSGYTGDGFTCAPINHCTAGTHTCDTNATCTFTGPGTYTCTCNPGYDGDGFTCAPINHCTAGTHTCDPNATCTYTGPGTYTCACNSGYSGDGFTCTPINHCSAGTHTCDPNATCTYTGPGTYTCACNSGYTGDGFTCTPINHCSAGTHSCDPNATCTYTGPGTYTCACNFGFTGDGFTCTPAIDSTVGHIILIGHDYFLSNSSTETLIGNAILHGDLTGDVAVLAYTEHADMAVEKPRTDAAIDARLGALGRTWTRTEFADYTLLGSLIGSAEVLLLYEQDQGNNATMNTIGNAWTLILPQFLATGGVIVAADGWNGESYGGPSRILDRAGVISVSAGAAFATGTLPVVDPTDTVATDMPTTYAATSSTMELMTTEGNVVVDSPTGDPVVVHKQIIYMVEDFETGTWPWSPWVSVGGGGTVGAPYAHDGSRGIRDPGWHYRTDATFGDDVGERVSVWVHPDDLLGRAYFGFASSGSGTRSCVMGVNTGELICQDNPSYSYVNINTTPYTYTASVWYRLEAQYLGTGWYTCRLYGSDGLTVLSFLSCDYGSALPGGVAMRSFTSYDMDTIIMF